MWSRGAQGRVVTQQCFVRAGPCASPVHPVLHTPPHPPLEPEPLSNPNPSPPPPHQTSAALLGEPGEAAVRAHVASSLLPELLARQEAEGRRMVR
jgi:hypothetical protein